MGYYDPHIDGFMDTAELHWLFETASKMESIVEVGSWKGKSTHALISGCKGPVFAIDHFRGSMAEIESNHIEAKTKNIYEMFHDNVGQFCNLCVLRMDHKLAPSFFKPKSIDMVFLDGSHYYADGLRDIKAWMPIAKKMLAGHYEYDRQLKDLGISYKSAVGGIWYLENLPQEGP
jgi:hypothetical protein